MFFLDRAWSMLRYYMSSYRPGKSSCALLPALRLTALGVSLIFFFIYIYIEHQDGFDDVFKLYLKILLK